MIVGENAGALVFSVTPVMADFLWENRIFFSLRPGKARLTPGTLLTVDRKAVLEPYVTFNAGTWVSTAGAHSYTNSNFEGHLLLGRHCSIGPGVRLSGFEHPMNALTTGLVSYDRSAVQMRHAMADAAVADIPPARSKRKSGVMLGHDVWIGSDVWLRHGIRIGTGAVVAANAVVAKDVPPYAIVGGNPARVLRMRFPDDQVARLLASEWWRLDMGQLSRFNLTDVPAFLAAYEAEGGPAMPAWTPKPIRLADELAALI